MTKTRYIVCEKCGAKIRDALFNESSPTYATMQEKEYCWSCAYWSDVIRKRGKDLEVINGVCYDFQPRQRFPIPSHVYLGMDGKNMFILRNDGQVKRSNDVWLIGNVPEAFRKELSDTAIEITNQAFAVLSRRRIECRDKGCFDRYQCIYYNNSREELTGPYNKIPENWVPGSENCNSFLSEEELKNFTPTIDSQQFHNMFKIIGL